MRGEHKCAQCQLVFKDLFSLYQHRRSLFSHLSSNMQPEQMAPVREQRPAPRQAMVAYAVRAQQLERTWLAREQLIGDPEEENAEPALPQKSRTIDDQPSSPNIAVAEDVKENVCVLNGRLPRRSVRSKSILPEEKVLVDLSMMDESRFYKMKGVAGDGLACKDDLQPGAPVIEYRGDYITAKEAKKRVNVYDSLDIKGSYQLRVQEKSSTTMVIDPTTDLTCMARYLNHSHRSPNLVVKAAHVDGRVRAILYAREFVKRGTELTFDYGDRRKVTTTCHPWLTQS